MTQKIQTEKFVAFGIVTGKSAEQIQICIYQDIFIWLPRSYLEIHKPKSEHKREYYQFDSSEDEIKEFHMPLFPHLLHHKLHP